MSSFFKDTVKARLNQNRDKYPLLKLNDLINWQVIGDQLRLQRKQERSDRRGNQGYDALSLFKAILLGQWHNLSDPALEHALAVRADFIVFCDFDDLELPDHSTLCRFRQWLMKDERLETLLAEINHQLMAQGVKVKSANLALVDASIIESPAKPSKKSLEVDKSGEVVDSPASKDVDAKWVKKGARFYLGYKLHARCDDDGYIEALTVTGANAHESQHLEPLIDGLEADRTVMADKGYDSQRNRALLKSNQLTDGIMHKARRGQTLSDSQRQMNRMIKQYRYVIEQSFGTLKRRFEFSCMRYFGLDKAQGQSYLKAMCLNLLKGINRVNYIQG